MQLPQHQDQTLPLDQLDSTLQIFKKQSVLYNIPTFSQFPILMI